MGSQAYFAEMVLDSALIAAEKIYHKARDMYKEAKEKRDKYRAENGRMSRSIPQPRIVGGGRRRKNKQSLRKVKIGRRRKSYKKNYN